MVYSFTFGGRPRFFLTGTSAHASFTSGVVGSSALRVPFPFRARTFSTPIPRAASSSSEGGLYLLITRPLCCCDCAACVRTLPVCSVRESQNCCACCAIRNVRNCARASVSRGRSVCNCVCWNNDVADKAVC